MDFNSIWIGGSGIALATLLFKNLLGNKSQTNEYIKTINMLRIDLSNFQKKMETNELRVNELVNKLHEKDKIVALLEATAWDTPFSYWLKDLSGKMLYINKRYEDQFKIKSSDYVGKSDFSVWDKEDSDIFRNNDLKLMESDEEYLIFDNEVKDHLVYKWKRRTGNVIIGIAGLCVPIENNDLII
jgi:PAS domain-containing protein